MSLLQYFQKASVSNESSATNLRLPSTNRTGLSSEEQSNVTLEINNAASINCKRKRVAYKEEDKCKIAKYANHCGTTNAVNRFKKEFPKLTESTLSVAGLLRTHRKLRHKMCQSEQSAGGRFCYQMSWISSFARLL